MIFRYLVSDTAKSIDCRPGACCTPKCWNWVFWVRYIYRMLDVLSRVFIMSLIWVCLGAVWLTALIFFEFLMLVILAKKYDMLT